MTGALQGGFVTIFPKPGPVPTAATINFQANQTLSNFFVSGATYSTSGQWISVSMPAPRASGVSWMRSLAYCAGSSCLWV